MGMTVMYGFYLTHITFITFTFYFLRVQISKSVLVSNFVKEERKRRKDVPLGNGIEECLNKELD